MAKRIVLMSQGPVIADGEKESILSKVGLLINTGIVPTQIGALSELVFGEDRGRAAFTVDEFVKNFEDA